MEVAEKPKGMLVIGFGLVGQFLVAAIGLLITTPVRHFHYPFFIP